MKKNYFFNCRDLSANRLKKLESGDLMAEIFHRKGDPETVHRIRLRTARMEVELLPSKGLSVGEAAFQGDPLFWEPPIGMPEPDTLDLWSDEVAIHGKAARGFTFLKTFNGGIELYGLKNWGMPVEKEGEQLLLHGETSNIPVESVAVHISPREKITVSGGFVYRTYKGDPSRPWYERGEQLCRVLRFIHLFNGKKPRLEVEDVFENVGSSDFLPDWGYHITFHPGSGSRILVPSRSVANRSGQPVPADFDRWSPAPDTTLREEQGMIHKGLQSRNGKGGTSRSLILREDASAVRVSFPVAPYFQTWICRGGASSREFTWVSSGEPLFRKPWDGIGIEIGSSALDHDGNTDPDVPVEKSLQPGTSRVISLQIDFPENEELEREILEIQRYNTDRSLKY